MTYLGSMHIYPTASIGTRQALCENLLTSNSLKNKVSQIIVEVNLLMGYNYFQVMDDLVVIIPALNEADNISEVVKSFQDLGFKKILVGLDCVSTDNTDAILKKAGVPYIRSQKTGYDQSVWASFNVISNYYPKAKYVLFADAGGKYQLNSLKEFYNQIQLGADLVIGIRSGNRAHLQWHQKLGTKIVLLPIQLFFHRKISDISPLRLIRIDFLKSLKMQPKKFRWPTEMLIKCLAVNAKIIEIPVISLKRKGTSKVSGSFKNSILAGSDMFSALRFIFFKI